MNLPYVQTVTFLSIYPKEKKIHTVFVYNVYSSFIHHCQMQEAT
jgi:hypothetical protein